MTGAEFLVRLAIVWVFLLYFFKGLWEFLRDIAKRGRDPLVLIAATGVLFSVFKMLTNSRDLTFFFWLLLGAVCGLYLGKDRDDGDTF